MKKKIMVLLMAAIVVGGVLTGCGNANEVEEPKNDKDVVVEESNDVAVKESNDAIVESNDAIEESSGGVEEIIEVETSVENDIADMSLVRTLYNLSQSEKLSVDGKIPMYTLKTTKTDDIGINENTMFNIVLYGASESMDESTVVKAFLDENKSISTATLSDIASSETILYPADSVIDNNVGFLIINNPDLSIHEPIANAIVANKDEADEVAHLVAYFGNDISYMDINDTRYAIFKTETLETGVEYVYYTVLNVSDDMFDGGIRLFSSYNDEDVNDELIYRRISNRGGLMDCDPSVDNDTGNIKTLYTPNVDALFE